MKRNLIVALLFACALPWSNLRADPNYCPYTNISSSPYVTSASSSCLDIAQFPLSICLKNITDTTTTPDNTYHSSSSLAIDPVGGRIYQALFKATDWTGQLLAYQIDPTTGIPAQTSLWDAGNVLTTLNNNGFSLNAYTFFHPSNNSLKSRCPGSSYCTANLLSGILFNYLNLSDAQINVLDPNNLYSNPTNSITNSITDYFTGYRTCEAPNTCTNNSKNNKSKFSFRQRPVLLGDLVNSDPLFVGSEDFNYDGLIESTTSSYRTFVNNKSLVDTSGNSPRSRMVYVGGNDGRLHGFEAGTWNTKNNAFDSGQGTELFSFFPGSVIGNDLYLRAFDSTSYTQTPFTTKNPLYHKYLVDGSPKAADAYFNGAWHTVLLGTTAGAASTGLATGTDGKLDNGGSIFALDVTNPSDFTTISTGTGKILWEFTNNPVLRNSANSNKIPFDWADSDLGITLSQPSLVRMQNKKWAAIVGNGYNSPNQIPVLYILDVSLPITDPNFIIAKITPCTANSSACPGSINGLSTPIAVDVDGDRKADYIYAGDLQGNLWKFDVNCPPPTPPTPSTGSDNPDCQPSKTNTDQPSKTSTYWGIANNGKPLFVACATTDIPCKDADRQPITSKPQVGSVSAAQANSLFSAAQAKSISTPKKASMMVYFGTGSYLGLCDIEASPSGSTCSQQDFAQQQTFYALWDKNTGDASIDTIAGRSSLYPQTILTPKKITQSDGNTAVTNVRLTSVAPLNLPCYQANPNTQCTLTDGTKVSSQSGWYLDLYKTPVSSVPGPSERSVYFPLLLNGNIVFTPLIPSSDPCTTQPSSMLMELDAITGNRPSNPSFLNLFGSNPSGNSPTNDFVMADGTTMAPSGVQSTVGILKTPALVKTPSALVKTFGGSTGGIQQVRDPIDSLGRVSWRQLR